MVRWSLAVFVVGVEWCTPSAKPPPVDTIPPADPGGVVAACCAIGDGPWHVKIKDVGGKELGAGRLWAEPEGRTEVDGNSATKDWYEYAERNNSGAWHWLDAGHSWSVSVEDTDGPADCGTEGFLPCQSIGAITSNINVPSAVFIDATLAGASKPVDAYHAEGTYIVTATWPNGAKKKAWFYTKRTGPGVHAEAFCVPAGWRWPQREEAGKLKVTWDIVHNGPLPSVLPTDTASCPTLPGGASAVKWQSDTIKFL